MLTNSDSRLSEYKQLSSMLWFVPPAVLRAFKYHVDRLQLEARFPGTIGISFARAVKQENPKTAKRENRQLKTKLTSSS